VSQCLRSVVCTVLGSDVRNFFDVWCVCGAFVVSALVVLVGCCRRCTCCVRRICFWIVPACVLFLFIVLLRRAPLFSFRVLGLRVCLLCCGVYIFRCLCCVDPAW
jgi:hypothetical protein